MADSEHRLRWRELLAVAILLAAWVAWKVYKLTLMTEYGPFSWEYWRPTLIALLIAVAVWGLSPLVKRSERP
jgi:hypothetical protein